MTLHTYLPQDRLRALSRGETLPSRTTGSVLFADISGFTALTEGLRNSLGPRQGAEELTKHLSTVYSALINEVEKYGGSVISFAGDAITCWFDEVPAELQTKVIHPSSAVFAISCAFALQTAMGAFTAIALPNGNTITLTLKVAVATGPVRRFMVGDPSVHYIDTLAGATVARTAMAEHLANKGEVLVDEATVNILSDKLSITEWRVDPESQERFAVIKKLAWHPDLHTEQPAIIHPQAANKLQAWMHRVVYEREQAGEKSFLTEFRPCAVLFVRFMGIDYDAEIAEKQLDTFIRQMQNIVEAHGGMLMDITIGDKGSYAYINFGALISHEDDARRAVKAALEIKNKTELQLQMGITQGVMRVGAYGGKTRQTFGALGDDVNLAARLMTNAAAGEILISRQIQKTTAQAFTVEPRSTLKLKGKSEPIPVFVVMGERRQRAIRLQEPTYALPMVGREQELGIINDKLELAKKGQGQVIGIVAEAGMGKSRLVAEVIRAARKKGFAGYGGACHSDAINTPYQAWKSVWQAFFDVDHETSLKKQMRFIEGKVQARAPERLNAMPLLNIVLDLEIPDNDFTRTLEPQYRKSALQALLEDCLRAAVKDEPLLIVIEDLHWIDALSHELLEELARGLNDSRICFVLAYRPPQLAHMEASRMEALPNFTKTELQELTYAEAEIAIRAKLEQLYPARGDVLPSDLVDNLMARAQGNPFYLEELLNYVRDRGLDPADMNKIELPDSLHSLILSRIDQLSEQEKNALRVASIVGRLFRADWLTGYYPELGTTDLVKSNLDQLAVMDITPLDSPEPELAYLFKHIVTHEVTYESLPFATRAKLHERLAKYLEAAGAAADAIAYHYGRSDNTAKKREYYKKVANAAQSVSAFTITAEYLTRLLDLTPETDPARSALALQLADAHYRQGDFTSTRTAIAQAQTAATNDADRSAALALLGEMTNRLGDHAEGQRLLVQAVQLARASDNQQALCHALSALGVGYLWLNQVEDTKAALDESLTLARALGNLPQELYTLLRLGGLAAWREEVAEAERLYSEVHTRAVAAGNRAMAMMALNNLGVMATELKDYAAAQSYYQQSLSLAREISAQDNIVQYIFNLAKMNTLLGQFAAARTGLREGLALALRLGSPARVLTAMRHFGHLALAEGQTARALELFGLARQQPAWNSHHQNKLNKMLTEWGIDLIIAEAGMKASETLDWDETLRELLQRS